MKSDRWEEQKAWNKDGISIGTYPFPPGKPLEVKDEPKEYFPEWIDNILFLSGYGKISAEYWGSPKKSPCYKLKLSTVKNEKYITEFFYSNPDQLNTLDGLYEEIYQKSKADSSKNSDIILKSPVSSEHAIGNKSFGLINKDIAEEVVFLRGNLLIKIKSQDHKDSRELARELDKAWQEHSVK